MEERICQKFGIENLKPYQLAAWDAVTNGRDVFISQPTGSGKSLVFQGLPYLKCIDELENRSLVLVISPLLSLMNDQLKGLSAKNITGIALSDALQEKNQENSHDNNDIQKCYLDILSGKYRIIYTSPEAVLDRYRKLLKEELFSDNLIAIVIDESHIIKKWGSQNNSIDAFRSWYGKIGELRSLLSQRKPVIAMTATANKETYEFICESLSLDYPVVLSSTPEKTNIYYQVVKIKQNDPDEFLSPIVDDLVKNRYKAKRVIIFCRRINDVHDIYGCLQSKFSSYYETYKDKPYVMYHANTNHDIKEFVTNSFNSTTGTIRVLVATIAFGLGIDCKGLNTIIHYGPPSSLDDYFQESGRCGRDGTKSVAILVLYPRSLSSSNISESMKKYCKNSTVCRRKILLKEFASTPSHELFGHACCDICQKSCVCSEDKECPVNVVSEGFHSLPNVPCEDTGSPMVTSGISETGKMKLRSKLHQLRDLHIQKLTGIIHSSVDLLSGFSLQAIDEIVNIANKDVSLEDIKIKTSILNANIYDDVKKAIEEVANENAYELDEAMVIEPTKFQEISSESESFSSDSDDDLNRYRPAISTFSDESD